MKKVYGICTAVMFAAVWFVGCQQAFAECGIASTYSSGTRTANGESYNHMGVSAAHKSLPFGTRVVVAISALGAASRYGSTIAVRSSVEGLSICRLAQKMRSEWTGWLPSVSKS